MELNEYESQSLAEIGEWEKQEGLRKNILDVASRPVDYIVKRIRADRFEQHENAIQGAVRGLGRRSLWSRTSRRCWFRPST